MDAATVYVLVTVTFGGTVAVNSNLPSLAVCRDAEQVAKTGKTVAEQKDQQDRENEARRGLEDACRSKPGALACGMRFSSSLPIQMDSGSIKFARCLVDPK